MIRDWTDKQVISHVAFVPSLVVALCVRHFYEPVLFVLPLLVLSTLYHRHHEPSGTLLSRTELCVAFILYFYGWVQLINSPSFTSFVLCGMCCAATSTIYVLTNPVIKKIDWDTWHYVGMHIIPGMWALFVSIFNYPVFLS